MNTLPVDDDTIKLRDQHGNTTTLYKPLNISSVGVNDQSLRNTMGMAGNNKDIVQLTRSGIEL